ncbi:MAG TPA: T9SS type A sorting domain-containing protein, partial [Candidatus Sabulitectum sp.]|nr:T9SS type A sorting domain-containing protein [Candidatus Sabulitectum sp.]
MFSGDRHQGVETFADVSVTLWRHDGTGIEGGVLNTTASVSPNPCSSTASVMFTTAAAGPASIQVYDIQGRLVQTGFQG